ncbi:hypothetical protein H5410_064645 [Solanum commersonii]|uniref:EF-hand domain-containing protein n=1 Tax=Solanum commersonii TaxID=4109 RepID=A0A9J5VZH1_SOLCO|nr:hypothetical protein H5410_064645 [Solanum commersonii]
MSVEVLDGATILSFVEDEQAFSEFIAERFNNLDKNHDGILSYSEMLKELQFNFRSIRRTSNGTVDLEEFKQEMKEMMVAMANGLGFLPIQMGLRVFDTHFGIDVKTDPNEVSRVYSSIFVQFDRDSNGTVDLEEFKREMKEMMVAMANGLGFLPIQMVLEENSFLKKAVDRELKYYSI